MNFKKQSTIIAIILLVVAVTAVIYFSGVQIPLEIVGCDTTNDTYITQPDNLCWGGTVHGLAQKILVPSGATQLETVNPIQVWVEDWSTSQLLLVYGISETLTTETSQWMFFESQTVFTTGWNSLGTGGETVNVEAGTEIYLILINVGDCNGESAWLELGVNTQGSCYVCVPSNCHLYTYNANTPEFETVTDKDLTFQINFVTEDNIPPIVDDIVGPEPPEGIIGVEYTFDIIAHDPDGEVVEYRFDWDGEQSSWSSFSSMRHNWTVAGIYDVRGQAKDDGGAQSLWSDPFIMTIIEPNQPPIADFTWTGNQLPGENIYFDASDSNDPDGIIVSWDWEFGDGNVGSGETITHSYSIAGTYQVLLTVTDDGGEYDSVEKPIIIGTPSETWTLTVYTKDGGMNVLQNVDVTISKTGYSDQINSGTTGEAVFLDVPEGNYLIRGALTGYTDDGGILDHPVIADGSVDLILTLVGTDTCDVYITVYEKDTLNHIIGATATINDVSQLTDENGRVIFQLNQNAQYSAIIDAEGYDRATLTISIAAEQEMYKTVELTPETVPGIPGFEIILLLGAILVGICKKKRKI